MTSYWLRGTQGHSIINLEPFLHGGVMHSACHQVEEGTVLNSAHFFRAHPSISPTSTTIELCKTWAISFPPPGEKCILSSPHRGEDGGEGMVNSFCLLSLLLATPYPCSSNFKSKESRMCRYATHPSFLFLSAAFPAPGSRNPYLCIGERERHPDLTFI